MGNNFTRRRKTRGTDCGRQDAIEMHRRGGVEACFGRGDGAQGHGHGVLFGYWKEGLMVGRAVLPKYFLEDVGLEGYEVLKRGGRRVGVSELPRVMVEGFLKDYMGVEVVLGRDLKVVCGRKRKQCFELKEEEKVVDDAIGIGRLKRCLDHPLLSLCKEIYLNGFQAYLLSYLLRFSPLFAELTDEFVPVALVAHVSMFYGTTAGGLKYLDPLFFLMNPFPSYDVEVLGKVPKEMTCGGGAGISRIDVANMVQRELGEALGYECTGLTRKDKYLMLAGNEGIVPNSKDGMNYGLHGHRQIDRSDRLVKRNHEALSVFGWGFLTPLGVLFARYCRQWDPVWYYLHVVVQFLGFLILPFFIRPQEDTPMHKFWSLYHRWFGWLTVLLAAVNIVYGLKLGEGNSPMAAGFAFIACIMIIMFTTLEIIFKINRRRLIPDSPAFRVYRVQQ
ncbi:hypothetical protein ACLOJK_037846 [Asimina triloba]